MGLLNSSHCLVVKIPRFFASLNLNSAFRSSKGCTYKNSYTVQPRQIISYNNGLNAKLSADQNLLEVNYNGIFYYKILNSKGETVVTGTINNSGVIDISYLPYGYYKICAQDSSVDDSVDFMKW